MITNNLPPTHLLIMQISIPTPCHENWDAMTPSAQGKFCGLCQHQVVDFSGKSDTEILSFFTTYESPCIRIETHRLDKPLVPVYTIPLPRTPYRWLRPLFTAALIATITVTNTYAQGAPMPQETEDTTPVQTTKGKKTLRQLKLEKKNCEQASTTIGKKRMIKKETPPPKTKPKTTGKMIKPKS